MNGVSDIEKVINLRKTIKEKKEQQLQKKLKKKNKKKKRRQNYQSMAYEIPTKVNRVNFNGIFYVSEDSLMNAIRPIYEVNNFGDLIRKTKFIHNELKAMGCFGRVDIVIDQSDDPDAVDININLKQHKMHTYDLESKVTETNDFCFVLTNQINNLFSKGAFVNLDIGGNFKNKITEISTRLVQSIYHRYFGRTYLYAEVKRLWNNMSALNMQTWSYVSRLGATIYPQPWMEQSINLNFLNRATYPFKSSHSEFLDPKARYKSSISHDFIVDTRDDNVLPKSGLFLKFFQEIAYPLAENLSYSNFFKISAAASFYYPLFHEVSLSLSGKISNVRCLNNSLNIHPSDSLMFINPLSCRGWNNNEQLSKKYFQTENNQTSVSASAKLLFPTPFLRSWSWLRKYAYGQFFCDYGNLNISRENFSSFNFGVGLAIKLGESSRAEINYCTNSFKNSGNFLFGIAVDFL